MKKRNPEARCETCPYYQHVTKTAGICVKPVPVILLTDEGRRYSAQPLVLLNDVCGEHPNLFG
jgi:hypothetical protein